MCWRKLVIEDDGVDVVCFDSPVYLADLTGTKQRSRVNGGTRLDNAINHHGARALGQRGEFFERFFSVYVRLGIGCSRILAAGELNSDNERPLYNRLHYLDDRPACTDWQKLIEDVGVSPEKPFSLSAFDRLRGNGSAGHCSTGAAVRSDRVKGL